MDDCTLHCKHQIMVDALVHWIQTHQDRPRHCIIISALQMYAEHVVDRYHRVDTEVVQEQANEGTH